jgi:DNA repair exonuclease SbcCD nuclease subunit
MTSKADRIPQPPNRSNLRVLLLADTHLGLDLPLRPQIERRRRGADFLANFRRALEPALRGEVDLVVHAGDLFDRSRVHPALVQIALAPLLEVAQTGVPVYLVPGNHERARIPLHLWTVHPNLHIFREPATFVQTVRGLSVALAGFPHRRDVRDSLPAQIEQTAARDVQADVRLLLLHQTVEGAQVGVQNYTFRSGPDVIRGRDVPGGFAAVLSGHIHRNQVLRTDLRGRPLATPVFYPGAVERTAFSERSEAKHYALLEFASTPDGIGTLVRLTWVPLPTRPMLMLDLQPGTRCADELTRELRSRLAALDPDAVVRIAVRGPLSPAALQVYSAAHVRSLAPASMNVELWLEELRRRPSARPAPP